MACARPFSVSTPGPPPSVERAAANRMTCLLLCRSRLGVEREATGQDFGTAGGGSHDQRCLKANATTITATAAATTVIATEPVARYTPPTPANTPSINNTKAR